MPPSPIQPSSDQTLYLLDISSFIFRAFFAIRPLHSPKGEPTNAVYGVATMLSRLNDEAKPSHLAALFDSKEPSFRKELFDAYKANRSEPPEDLIPQFDRIEELVSAMKIPALRKNGVEADDLIATLTRHWIEKNKNHKVVIVSGDKDLMQLVTDRVSVWDTMKNKVYGIEEVKEKFGVRPDQVRDYLAIVGDSSDNIPGIRGIGPKGAAELLNEYETLEGILKAARAGKVSGKKGEVLKESEKSAKLSQELATVKSDVKVSEKNLEFSYQFEVGEELVEFLKTMGFQSLLERWNEKAGGVGTNPVSDKSKSDSKFIAIQDEKKFEAVLAQIEKKKEFGFDLETTSLNPREAKIVGVALCTEPEKGYYIPIGHQTKDGKREKNQLESKHVLDRLKPYLENPKYKKIGQNLKYDFSVLIEHGLDPDGIGADTMVASYVLEPSGKHNLKTLALQYLDYEMLTYEEVCGKGAQEVPFDQISIETATRYSAEDAWVAYRLWHKLLPLLEKEKLMPVYSQVDLPLVPVLTRMELVGVRIDEGYLKKLSQTFAKEIQEIEERISTYTKEPINLNSPKQLAKLLFEELKLPVQSKTKTGPSTDASVLEALAPLHEVPKLLLNYREIAKLKGTYVDPLPELVDKKTHRIHASFHQAVAATGRLSSSDPNLQNIPIRTERGRKIRKAFIPSEGNVLLSADYSQIELRILAHMSGDKELVRSFQSNEDVHQRTASEIFDCTLEAVTDEQRGIAKAISFGLMYGKTAFGLSQELKIPRRQAQETIDRYFERYKGVKQYLDGLITQVQKTGETTTLLGRKRKLPEIHSKNPAIRNNAERMAMNTPIQGTAADLMKLAMIEIDHCLKKDRYRSTLIIQVHDEVVLDCDPKELKEVQSLVQQSMETAMKFSVPLKVNLSHGDNWMDL